MREDELFDEDGLFAALEEEIGDVDTSDVIDFSTLTNTQLLDIWTSSEEELMASQHAIWPKDQKGRDLTSIRQAAMLLYKKRTGIYPADFPRDP